MTRVDVESEDIPKYFQQSASLINLVKHTENDAFLAMSLMFKLVVIPLTKQLASLSGNLWSRYARIRFDFTDRSTVVELKGSSTCSFTSCTISSISSRTNK